MNVRLNLIVTELEQNAIVRQPREFSLVIGHAKGFARQRQRFGLFELIFAIWKPGIGGIISIIYFLVFNLLVALGSTSKYAIVLLIFMIPFVLFSYRLKKSAINNLIS